MAAHVTERAGAEVEPLAPVAGMIPAAADKRTFRADADPMIPVEARRNRIDAARLRLGIAPLLAAPGVDFLDLADDTVLHHLNGGAVFR